MIDAPKFPPFEGFSWDRSKREANLAKHGVDFSQAENFDFSTALVLVDHRYDYGEVREIALGPIGNRLHVLVYARRAPLLRVISLRKANRRERNRYEEKKA
jgi:uncharacterized DUF497 family protein